jgi:zinc transport system substrate-binding protein
MHERIKFLKNNTLIKSFCFAAVLAAPLSASAEPKVVVTTKPIHSLVSSVMAGVGQPKLIVDGAASPHTFTLKPSAARAISKADVFIRVSDQLEPFTRKVVSSLQKSVTLITLADASGMALLDQREGGSFEEHEHDGEHGGHGHDEHDHDSSGHSEHGAKDGHIWLDPENAKIIVENVAAVLAAKYPESADALKSNAASTLSKIDSMTAEIEGLLAPVKGKPFIIFHDATQYFEKRFGVVAGGSITVSPDVQPSAKRLTQVRKKIADLGAVCVFAEPGFQPKLVNAVTEGTKARSGSLDAEGALLDPGPDLYFVLMRGLARSLSSCLGPSA